MLHALHMLNKLRARCEPVRTCFRAQLGCPGHPQLLLYNLTAVSSSARSSRILCRALVIARQSSAQRLATNA